MSGLRRRRRCGADDASRRVSQAEALPFLPVALTSRPMLTPVVATALVVESLALALLYSRFSLRIEAANPMVWVLLMAILGALVAYGRFPR